MTVFLVLSLTSCDKETPDAPDKEVEKEVLVSDYYPLEIGNYWVYDCYRIDNGQEVWFREDSVYITGTKNIDGKEYYVHESFQIDMIPPKYMRIEGNTLVDQKGVIQFSIDISSDIIREDEYPNYVTIQYSMEEEKDFVRTPAADFSETLNFTGFYNWHRSNPSAQRHSIYNQYAKGMGRVAYSRYPCCKAKTFTFSN